MIEEFNSHNIEEYLLEELSKQCALELDKCMIKAITAYFSKGYKYKTNKGRIRELKLVEEEHNVWTDTLISSD